MRKTVFRLDDEINEERPRSKLPLVFFVLFLVIGLGPLALEGASVCVANWKGIIGVSTEAPTPILDAVQDNLHEMNDGCRHFFSPWLRSLPWEPRMVLAVAGVIMALAMLMLRR